MCSERRPYEGISHTSLMSKEANNKSFMRSAIVCLGCFCLERSLEKYQVVCGLESSLLYKF